MTNKELADRLERCTLVLRSEDVDITEAARRPRELSDSTAEPAKDLRWLVERHECLRAELEWDPDAESDKWPWYSANEDETTQAYFSDAGAMLWIRGIVKAKCDRMKYALHGYWYFRPWDDGWIVYAGAKEMKSWDGKMYDTELEAIDALLNAMEGKD